MPRKADLSAGVRAKQSTRSAALETPDESPRRGRAEPSLLVAVRLPISLDDELEEQVLRVNQAARAANRRKLTKRELIELALRQFVTRTSGEILDMVDS